MPLTHPVRRGVTVAVALVMCVGLSAGASNAQTQKPLEGTYWKAVELAGKPLPKQDPAHEAHLQFQPANRVSGSDGCNRITGSYALKGDLVTFGQLAGTQMACINVAASIERGFRDALKSATRLIVKGDRLELSDAKGQVVAAFAAGTQPAAQLPDPGLAGTTWRLVRIQGGDGRTLVPNDPANYMIAFTAGGDLTARIDCNKGRGTWRSSKANELQLSPLALTRMQCPAGSLHDQIAKQWSSIRSYEFKGGHLFLSLPAGGGSYEFEPAPRK